MTLRQDQDSRDEDDLLAAEFALGLLDADEAEAVQRRARVDAPLSLRIAWWRDQLAPLADDVQTDVPAHLWQRIDAALPSNDDVSLTTRDTARPWRWATAGLGLVAASLLAFIVMRPQPVPVVPNAAPAPMVAALSGEKGALVAVSYDATSGALRVSPEALDAGAGDAELWIIPEGGKAVSLGIVNAKIAETHNVPAARRPLMQPGATFAITREAKGGSPTGVAQGPIVAAGKIIRT